MTKLMSSLSVLLISVSAFASTAVPDPHRVVRCQNGEHDTVIFNYDEQGAMGENQPNRPGFCQLTNDYSGNAYGGYFCWVADTQTAFTTDGQLAIQFMYNEGSGAYLYTQLNVPKQPGLQFAATKRVLSRPAKDLRVPIAPRDADRMECKVEVLNFTKYVP